MSVLNKMILLFLTAIISFAQTLPPPAAAKTEAVVIQESHVVQPIGTATTNQKKIDKPEHPAVQPWQHLYSDKLFLSKYNSTLLNRTFFSFLKECDESKTELSDVKKFCPTYYNSLREFNESNINFSKSEIEEYLKVVNETSPKEFCKNNFPQIITENKFYNNSYNFKVNSGNEIIVCSKICYSSDDYALMPVCVVLSWLGQKIKDAKPKPLADKASTIKKNPSLVDITDLSNIKEVSTSTKLVAKPSEDVDQNFEDTEEQKVSKKKIEDKLTKISTTDTILIEDPTSDEDEDDDMKNENTDFDPDPPIKSDSKAPVDDDDNTAIDRHPFEDTEPSNSFTYFIFALIILTCIYIFWHYKSKIMGLIIEGRRTQHRGRRNSAGGSGRKHTAAYRKLDSNLEEAINSSTGSRSQSQIIY